MISFQIVIMIPFEKLLLSIFISMTINILLVNCHAVMSVDLGTEFMKIGVVKPGVPMEIALNKYAYNAWMFLINKF